jgi:hypothetical protein
MEKEIWWLHKVQRKSMIHKFFSRYMLRFMSKINMHNNSYWLDIVLFIESRYDLTRMYHTVLITMFIKQVKTLKLLVPRGISLYILRGLYCSGSK